MKRLMFLALSALVVAAPVQAKSKAADAKPKATPAELEWADVPPMLPPGAQMAVVSGDPMKAGKFVLRLKMPSNYAVPAHWHPTDEKVSSDRRQARLWDERPARQGERADAGARR